MGKLLSVCFATLLVLSNATLPSTAALQRLKTFDINRYLGTWHEIARLPVFYQNGCSNSKAIYKRVDATRFSVTNTCDRGGRTIRIQGEAVESGIGEFKVAFKKIFTFRADYIVHWIEPNYKMAVVGVPRGNRVWILSRSPNPSKSMIKQALQELRKNGYPQSKLIWNNADLAS